MKTSLIRCPSCGIDFDPRQLRTLPFCSERCRQIDLGRWLDEEYGLEVLPDPDGDVERDFDAADPTDGGAGSG